MLIPVALFGQAIGTAAYPFMARLVAEEKMEEMNNLLSGVGPILGAGNDVNKVKAAADAWEPRIIASLTAIEAKMTENNWTQVSGN